ncbi:isocitrate lyase/phosphoenolpyruvate mutase family protein [Chitinimonas sp.]|uniref:isocitrate lyase/PEP mutase family protein n=1 Tax=Chitinimonas sp. TaxID=1934313 RepID=UPI002F944EC0
MQTQIDLAQQFRQLNQQGRLLLANAWDVASARIYEQAGALAIGTTSGGIAYSQGYQDAELIGRDAMLRVVAAIARSVRLPVSADIEAGYGPSAEDVANSVRAAIAAGAVGVNIEDNSHGLTSTPLFDIDAHCLRLHAARTAADAAGVPVWINARTDTYLLGLGEDAEARFADTVVRARAYLAAGADMVFVPVLTDPATVRRLVEAVGGPISLMAMPGGPSAAELFAAGAARVSLGVFPMLAAMATVRDIAAEALGSGTWQTMSHSYGYAEAEALFATR